MIKKIIPTELQKYLIIGISVFLVILFWGGRLMYNSRIREVLKYRAQRARVALENKVGADLEKLKKIRADIKTVSESSRFLAEVAKIAGQLNLKLRSISALPIEKRNELTKLTVDLDIDTEYNELGFFVSKLENSDLFISIDKLEITKSAEIDRSIIKSSVVSLTGRFTVSTFFLTDTVLEK